MSKLKFIRITQFTREKLGKVPEFIQICLDEFTWVRVFTLKLIRIKISPVKTLPTFFSILVFIWINSFRLLLLWTASKCNKLIRIDFHPFSQFTQINPPSVNRVLAGFNLAISQQEVLTTAIRILRINNWLKLMMLREGLKWKDQR